MSVKFITVPSKVLAKNINPTDLTFQVNNIVGWDGNALTAADFGSQAWCIFRNAENTLMEIMEFDPSTIAVTNITILKRGLKFTGDLTTQVTANKLTWIKQDTTVEFGTDVPQLLSQASGVASVTGPGSSTDNAVARFDATTGSVLQNSTVLIDDTGNVTGLGTLNTKALPAGTIVGTSDTQALTNKTLTSPSISSPTITTEWSFGAHTAGFTETDNGNSSTAKTIDWTTSNKQKITMTGNCTFTFTAPTKPCSLILKVVQDATGSRLATWPATVHWSGGTAPTLTTTVSKVDIITLYYDGTTYFGASTLNYTA